MDPRRASIDATDLVRDLDWLARLARRIVQDPGLADDAVQEAWMAASRRTADGARPARRALVGALRGILKQSWRTDRRRRRREREAARPEALLSAEQILIIAERQQLLWRHLAELREPFRSTLIRRFQQGAELEAIAAQEGVGVDAIRWRIRRGLGMLRGSLERGGREPGALVLAPLIGLGGPLSKAPTAAALGTCTVKSAGDAGTILGAVLMKKTTITAACVIAAILLGGSGWRLFKAPPTEQLPGVGRAADDMDVPLARGARDAPEALGLAQTGARVAARAGAAEPGVKAAASAVTTISGRIVDPDGLPIPGVQVRIFLGALRPTAQKGREWEIEDTAGADGRFHLECPRSGAQQATLMASLPPYTDRTIQCFGTGAHCKFPPLTVPSIDAGDITLKLAGVLRGRIVNGEGAGVEGATVHVPNVWRSEVTTGPDGGYVLTSITAGERYVSASFDGHSRAGTPIQVVPGVETEVPTLVVRRGGVLRGRVIDPDGRPIAGALVDGKAQCDGSGVFELPVGGPVARYVRAEAAGYRTSRAHAFELGADALITLHPMGRQARFDFVDASTGEVVPLPKVCRVTEREVPGAEPLGAMGLAGWRDPQLREASDQRPRHWTAMALAQRDAVQVEATGFVDQEAILGPEAFDGGIQKIALTPVPMGPLTGLARADGQPLQHAAVEVLEFEELDLSGDRIAGDPGSIARPIWRIKERHRVFTDERGRFEYRGELVGPVQAVVHLANSEALVSERVRPAVGESVDLGELSRTTLSSLTGSLAFSGRLPAEIALTEYGSVALETRTAAEAREAKSLTAGGSFRFDALLPGLHAVRLRLGLLGEGARGRIYLIDVPSGSDHGCTLDVELPALATIELHLTVNGVPWARYFYANLIDRSTEPRTWSSFDDPVGGRTQITVPASRDYQLMLDLGLTDYDGSFEPAVDVICPPGLSRLDVNIETAELLLTLPPSWDPESWGWVFLEWTDSDGLERMPIPCEQSLTAPILRADQAVGHTVRFVSVPVDVNRARVVFRAASDGDEPAQVLGKIQLRLEPGAISRVGMQ